MRLFTPVATFAMLALLAGSALADPSTQTAPNSNPDTVSSPGLAGAVTFNLNTQNSSGETGTATLRQVQSDVSVTLTMTGTGVADMTQPAHIHTGTCANLDPAPKYPLNPITKGSSVTIVKGVTLKSLETGGFAINVHKSAAEAKIYVACGDIPKT